MDPKLVHVVADGVVWFGHTLDFIVAQAFFLHPRPVYGGRFLEIGAQDGLSASNTWFFEQYLGWTGVLFEPTKCITKVRRNRPRASSYKGSLCPSPTNRTFKSFGRCKKSVSVCKPLRDYDKNEWSNGFDFVSIDVEGAEIEVLESLALTKIPIKVFVIENRHRDGNEQKIIRMLPEYRWARLSHAKLRFAQDLLFWRPDLLF